MVMRGEKIHGGPPLIGPGGRRFLRPGGWIEELAGDGESATGDGGPTLGRVSTYVGVLGYEGKREAEGGTVWPVSEEAWEKRERWRQMKVLPAVNAEVGAPFRFGHAKCFPTSRRPQQRELSFHPACTAHGHVGVLMLRRLGRLKNWGAFVMWGSPKRNDELEVGNERRQARSRKKEISSQCS